MKRLNPEFFGVEIQEDGPAVRITHLASGVQVISDTFSTQSENHIEALSKLIDIMNAGGIEKISPRNLWVDA